MPVRYRLLKLFFKKNSNKKVMEKQDFSNQYQFDPLYCNRTYRQRIKSTGLLSYQVKEKESDLFIQTPVLFFKEAREYLHHYRMILEEYIKKNPLFRTTLRPFPSDSSAHPIVKEMIEVSALCQVGPMAAVAGCIAQNVGERLLTHTEEVIIENGGDLYIKSSSLRRVIIFAGSSPLSNKLYLRIDSRESGIGVCTSSGTVGPSFSMGKADAVTVIAPSASLADAAATAIANTIQTGADIEKGLNLAQQIDSISGVVIIKDDKMGMWGDIDYGIVRR